ncbi:smoothened homolog [Pollicipes pollicipes]|uniref:smoothened homolog n=1 Tax=Pollicipes pollicipes TaxID=41117 RepID=UPI001884A55B|nr:smoothened homolog [Pollicipes pollicipes]
MARRGLWLLLLLSSLAATATGVSGQADQLTPTVAARAEGSGDAPADERPPVPLPDARPPPPFIERLPAEGAQFGALDDFSSRQGRPLRTCHRPAVCQPLRRGACFGTALRHTATSLNLTVGIRSQESVKEELNRWEALQNIPKCWSVIQPFLCAVFMPKCENGSVELPSLEMCQKVRGQCQFADALFGWPPFLECHESRFPSNCRNSLLDLKYNTSTSCLPPLVPTKNKLAFYPTVEGCAEPCRGLLYTDQQRQDVHRFVHVFGGLSFALTFLTVMTHVIDWRSFCKYAANRCIFYINLCLCLAILGFLVQFVDESRDTVVCHRDGTARGPGSEESATPCTAVFVLIYYPVIAALCWFVMLAFSWNITFKTFGQSREIQERLNGLTSYFHLISWSVPLILTTAALATSDVVDSDYLYGVCFIGFGNWHYRLGFVLVPSVVATLVGGFFLIRSVRFLVRQRPDKTEKKLVVNISIARLCVCGSLLVAAVAVSVACHVLEYGGREQQRHEVHRHLLCRANATARRHLDYGYGSQPACPVSPRPAPLLLKAHVFCLFAVGVLFSSWVWRRSTLRSWNRFYRRVVGKPEERPVRRIRKHQVIAQAWSKRYDLAQHGRISLSFHSTHSDPVGMYLGGLNSGTSESPSSSFFAAIPSLMERRGALIGSTSSALGLSRNSDGSLYSVYSRGSRYSRTSRHSRYSRRLSHDSEVSRRHSLDSTRSLYRSEADRVAALLGVEAESGGSVQGRDNASYVDSEPEEVGAGRARRRSHEDDGRRRQSRGQSSNVSSGSSIVNLRQRLLGDVAEFARARRKAPRDASPPWTEAAIELAKLADGGGARDNQALVSVAVQTAPAEPTGDGRASLTLHNDLPYTKNAQRLSLPLEPEPEPDAEKALNASRRSSGSGGASALFAVH